MRTVKKRPQPKALTQWRALRMVAEPGPGLECTYAELRRDPCIPDIEDGLFEEQGGICAYAGHRLDLQPFDRAADTTRKVGFHLEHLTPQKYCTRDNGNYGKDTSYENLVACWPKPNCGFTPAYGAIKKGDWPAPVQEPLFVSPVSEGCTARFKFDLLGRIMAANPSDEAANETIQKLGLDHPTLIDLRKKEIEGALSRNGQRLSLRVMQRLRDRLDQRFQNVDQGSKVRLPEFAFAIRSALETEIVRMEKRAKAKG